MGHGIRYFPSADLYVVYCSMGIGSDKCMYASCDAWIAYMSEAKVDFFLDSMHRD